MHVKWLRVALESLDAEAQYIANDNVLASGKLVAAMRDAVKLLADFPALGRPGRVSGTRELVVPGTPYIIPYRVRGNTIHILRVLHAARKWPKSFDSRKQ
jgi:addiction module RelE/StbE family toxin